MLTFIRNLSSTLLDVCLMVKYLYQEEQFAKETETVDYVFDFEITNTKNIESYTTEVLNFSA